ncbi:phosphoribosylanthranilate isomerase [Caulobacter sp. 73W]|uniref:N-(5'-phosphoribosyl)anthranilate isomerase n=1 Tax=Caulobacter sp. 73W TaxID=3161137 RepID=A0AB39KN84_9CAUL
MTTAKICGLSTPEAVKAALDGKASHIGFVFFPKSPRDIDPQTAARLALPARAKVKVVAVTVDPDDALLEQLMATLKPHLIQVHGKETPNRIRDIAMRTGAGVIKALSVSTSVEIEAARAFEEVVEHLMFDAKPPKDSELPGGTGARFDWTLLKGRRFARPWFLAGGLDPWNVREAIEQSDAPLVDVSSGVERGAGLKDPVLITSFLDAVRRG